MPPSPNPSICWIGDSTATPPGRHRSSRRQKRSNNYYSLRIHRNRFLGTSRDLTPRVPLFAFTFCSSGMRKSMGNAGQPASAQLQYSSACLPFVNICVWAVAHRLCFLIVIFTSLPLSWVCNGSWSNREKLLMGSFWTAPLVACRLQFLQQEAKQCLRTNG